MGRASGSPPLLYVGELIDYERGLAASFPFKRRK